ncbi:MAG: tripartite tricarboxylate transporter substrate binding protein [Betaproteobacteria bacterium]|nr:tripartite tricarboxylate transporter substrate binding protein [Betaproteobacteria bacterium]
MTARIIAQKLTQSLGQNVLVDNRPGAGSTIGVNIAAKSAPDGYTMVLGTIGPIAIAVSLFSKLPYDPAKDLLPVVQVVDALNVLAVHPSLPVKSVKELIAVAKRRPGELNYGDGVGSTGHLAGALFNTMTGTTFVLVPYGGSAPAVVDLLAGNIQLMFITVSNSLGLIKNGKLRGIAMTGTKRSSLLPELPTIAEAGVPGYAVNNWYGVFTPARTPGEIVMRLNAEIVKILNTPDIKQRLLESGLEAVPSTSEQFAAYIQLEIKKWAKVVKDTGVKLD